MAERIPKIAIVLPHNIKEDRAAYRGVLDGARRCGPWRCILAEAGIRVPEDLAVLGVDDDPILCESTFPTLSSIRTGRFRMGQRETGMSMTEWRRRKRDAPDE